MYQNKAKSGFAGQRCLSKPLCAAMILCSCLVASPSVALASGAPAVTQSTAPQITAKGHVVDATGEPIIGANILQVGTTNGTITDIDGNFTLSVPSGSTLEISYIGYLTQRVKATASMNIVLQEDDKTLDEVVVIGYGAVKKRDLTGAVASVKSEDITLTPASNPMQSLQGKIAGLDITRSSGQAGASPTVQLRGTRSLQLDDDGNISTDAFKPTYLIDGMPGDITTLNPNDIESIEVLKDASSTAIYGSSGANGVIIVTTKGAKSGKPVINFNAYLGTTFGARVPKMLSGDSYINYIKDAARVAGNSTDMDQLFNTDELNAINGNQWIKWGDEVLHSGFTQNYSASVAGGTDKTKAYFSINYSDEKSQYKNDKNKVYSTRVRIDQEINKWLSAGVNVQASFTNRDARSGVYERALFATPLGEPYAADGTINQYPIPGSSADPNPLADEQKGVFLNNTKNGRVYVDGYLVWKPIDGLSIKTQLGGSYYNSRNGKLVGNGAYNTLKSGGASTAEMTNSTSYNYKWENIITYHKIFNKDHDLTLTGVSTWNYDQSERYYIYGENPATNDMKWYGIENADNKKQSSYYSMSKGLGFIGRANYSYKGKYMASASVRYEGSSRLASDKRWNAFPAFSLGWRASEESFMEGTKNWLSNLKFRLGYGVAGTTAGIGPFSSMVSLVENKTTLGGLTVPASKYTEYITNKNLTWEKSHDWNFGIDASFLKNRIDLTLDLYRTKTSDVIIAQTLPTSVMGTFTGTTPYKMNMNAAETLNKGIEAAITSRNIISDDFTWNTTLTFSANKEEIKSLIDGQDMIMNSKNGDMVFKVGEAVGSYYKYKVKGIWQYSERETAALFGCQPGDIKLDLPSVKHDATGYYYMDTDNNRVDITDTKPYTVRADYDRQVVGKTSPDWTLGLKNDFRYKDFDLSFFLYGRFGQTMNYGSVIGKYSPAPDYNIPTYFTYYDTTLEKDQDVLFYAINSSKNRSAYTGYDSMYFVDGSFFKLKNVTLGYTLPKTALKNLGISNLRVYATLTNLLTFSFDKYVKDYDPEMNGSIDFPLSRECVFGVNLTF